MQFPAVGLLLFSDKDSLGGQLDYSSIRLLMQWMERKRMQYYTRILAYVRVLT